MPVQIAPTIFGTTSNNSGTSTGLTTATFTVPTSIVAGHTGVLFLNQGGSAVLNSITGTTNGWQASTSTPFANGSTLQTYIYVCALVPADSGVTVTVTFASAQRWSGGIMVFAGSNQSLDVVATSQRTATTTNTAVTLPNYTPSTSYGMLCYFTCVNTFTSGTSSTVTPGSGLTEQFDTCGSCATSVNIGAEVATITSGQIGQMLQTAPTGCVSDSATKQYNVMVVGISPLSPVSSNNYEYFKVGDGMSTTERIR